MKFLSFFILLFILVSGCKDNKDFESMVEIVRMEKVRLDEKGEPLVVDVEISYYACPGTQMEVIRGDKNFADCLYKSHKVGDKLKVHVNWYWDSFGYYKWKVTQLNGCPRRVDPLDEISFELVQECEDYYIYGVKVGFSCNQIPNAALIEKCPWFRRK